MFGLLFDEAAGTPPIIDFLHPRKKPERTNVRRRNSLIAAGVAAVGLVAIFLVWMRLNSLDDEATELRAESARLKSQVVAAEKTRKEEELGSSLSQSQYELAGRTRFAFAVAPTSRGRIGHASEWQRSAAWRGLEDRRVYPRANSISRNRKQTPRRRSQCSSIPSRTISNATSITRVALQPGDLRRVHRGGVDAVVEPPGRGEHDGRLPERRQHAPRVSRNGPLGPTTSTPRRASCSRWV